MIIFDCDGLLLDTEFLQYKAWAETLQNYGIDFPKDEWSKYAGKSAYDNCKYFKSKFGITISEDEIIKKREATFNKLISGRIELMPYAQEILNYCKTRGIKTGLASNTLRKELTLKLRNSGLSGFDVVVSREEIEKGKPAPDIYLEASKRLKVTKENTIVLEDSQIGVLAARRAGLYCCAIPNQFTAKQKFSHADIVCDSLLFVIKLIHTSIHQQVQSRSSHKEKKDTHLFDITNKSE